MAHFYLDQFGSAKKAFDQAKGLGNKSCDLWLRKVDAELRRVAATASTTKVPTTTPAPTSASTPAVASNPSAAAAAPLASKVRDNWFQGKETVQITLFAKNLEEKDVHIVIEPRKVSAELTLPDGSKYSQAWSLFAEVQEAAVASAVKVTKYKVEINLKKVVVEAWKGLEATAALPPNVVKRENEIDDSRQKQIYPYSGKW